MNHASSTSFAATLLLTCALPFSGCASEGEPARDDELMVHTAGLSRSVDLASDSSAKGSTARAATGTVTKTPVIATPVAITTVQTTTVNATGSDLERNHPWVVDVGGTGGLSCRGVLIHPSWVLTAAHCIGPYAGTVSYTRTDPTTGAVSQGSRPMNASGPKRGMFVHPDYVFDSGFGQPKNDIALIRLATPFVIDRNIQTAALPSFFANAGRTGTIPTHNHGGSLPAGYTAVLRSPQISAAQCPSPAGFLCLNPPAGSLCEGDSGSGFIEQLDGRAQVVGITSNMSSDGSSCIPAGGQAQMTDVFFYRTWILNTMGMGAEQVAGRVRLRWAGTPSPSIMSLQCLSADLPAIEVPMNVPGGEIAMDCDDARVFCQAQGANMSLSGFSLRTLANGTSSVQALSYLSSWTAAFGDPGTSFLQYTCSVSAFGVTNVSTNTGGVLAQF
jgi:hypothetical protein